MSDIINQNSDINAKSPISFIGVSDFVQTNDQPFPFGPIDLFRLSRNKGHYFYPTISEGAKWIFSINRNAIDEESFKTLKLSVYFEDGELCYEAKIDPIIQKIENVTTVSESEKPKSEDNSSANGAASLVAFTHEKSSGAIILSIAFDGPLWQPGKYIVRAELLNEIYEIGEIHFHYTPVPKPTKAQIEALKSNPGSAKNVIVEIRCKFCDSKINVYTALEKNKKFEKKNGVIWYEELPKKFTCSCGKNDRSLQYIRENMHALLLRDYTGDIAGISYVRQYAHTNIVNVIERFEALLEKEEKEEPIQKFIEKNTMLLAQFHAKNIYLKPSILSKFKSDFAILDASNRLWLIEIERPTLKLFKSNGHITADHLHAYQQVHDWLNEVEKYRAAVLEGLNLENDSVVEIKGAVIAGRSQNEDIKYLRKHLSNRPYADIDFYTLDDLSRNLFEISKALQ